MAPPTSHMNRGGDERGTQGVRCTVYSGERRVESVGCRVQGVGCRVLGVGCWV
jgi:hypothetical protein